MNTKPKNIETTRLTLTPCTKEILAALFEGHKALAAVLQVNIPDAWTEFGEPMFRFTYNRLTEAPDEINWMAYLPIYKPDNMLAGSCGYTGKPDANGVVEIGYEIAPHYRNIGLATELAKALIANAFNYNEVTMVQAHTLAEENASGKVLQRCGMLRNGEVMHPEDGLLWRWELKKPTTD